MKLLHVCDLHMDARWLEWLALQAPKYDVVVIAGGILNHDSPAHRLNRQITTFRAWALNFPGRLVLCSGLEDVAAGNHRAPWLEALAREQITVDRGLTEVKGWTIEAVPLGLLPVRPREKGIAVSALGPFGAKTAAWQSDGVQDGNPDWDLLLRQARGGIPRYILSGSVYAPTQWSECLQGVWNFNPGRGDARCPVPNHIVLDLENGFAEWRTPEVTAVHPIAI